MWRREHASTLLIRHQLSAKQQHNKVHHRLKEEKRVTANAMKQHRCTNDEILSLGMFSFCCWWWRRRPARRWEWLWLPAISYHANRHNIAGILEGNKSRFPVWLMRRWTWRSYNPASRCLASLRVCFRYFYRARVLYWREHTTITSLCLRERKSKKRVIEAHESEQCQYCEVLR